MGFALSKISRKIKRFNVENRAHRLLEKDEPRPPPKYETSVMDMQRTLEADPDFVKKQSQKDSSLDARLKQVYVTSRDNAIEYKSNQSPEKPLPLSRSAIADFEYGFMEPVHVPRGKCTLRQALEFLNNHAQDSSLWTIQRIAADYTLKEDTVEQIAKYFRTFQMYIPDKSKKESLLSVQKQKFLNDSNEKR